MNIFPKQTNCQSEIKSNILQSVKSLVDSHSGLANYVSDIFVYVKALRDLYDSQIDSSKNLEVKLERINNFLKSSGGSASHGPTSLTSFIDYSIDHSDFIPLSAPNSFASLPQEPQTTPNSSGVVDSFHNVIINISNSKDLIHSSISTPRDPCNNVVDLKLTVEPASNVVHVPNIPHLDTSVVFNPIDLSDSQILTPSSPHIEGNSAAPLPSTLRPLASSSPSSDNSNSIAFLSHDSHKETAQKSKRRRAKKKTKSSPIKPTNNALIKSSNLELHHIYHNNLILITKLKNLLYENSYMFPKEFVDTIMKELSNLESSIGTDNFQVSQESNHSIISLISKVEFLISQWHINASMNLKGGVVKGQL